VTGSRWRFTRLRAVLRPANRYALDRWVAREGARLDGLVLNVGSGLDVQSFGRRVIRLDRYAPRPTVRADLQIALPFTSAAFDAVVCTEVLEHVVDARFLLSELARVVRPGGRLLVSVPFVFHYHEDPRDVRRYTPAGLRAALQQAGFDVEVAGGLGNKLTALFLLVESLHPITKLLVRVALVPIGNLCASERAHDGVWSDWAANAVALARRR
jgi:SAM-dependent methyltransferase